MTSFAANSLRALRRLLRAPASGRGAPSPDTVMDGLSAVAFVEASISDSAALGASYPAALGARVWSQRCAHAAINRLGRLLVGVEAGSPRGALSAAVGLAAAGERATVFISGPDCLAAQDILAHAAGLHVPLVVHLASRATAGHAQALGTGHEALHAAGERGLFVLTAANVQEAVDLALIARRVAERALVPGLVAMDVEQTALAAQEVQLPDADLLRTFVGDPGDPVDPSGDVQRLLFGRTRRRVPRTFDLEHPVMRGSYQGQESWGLGAAAGRVYFDEALERELTSAVREYETQTGRGLDALRLHEVDDAKIVLVAQGSAVETAVAVAAWARREMHVPVGVVGVRRLRPFPGAAVVEALRGARTVAIMERLATPLGDDGPLARDVRIAFDRARENTRHDAAAHPGYPTLRTKDGPRIVGVSYGLGGLPVRAADVAALVRELAAPRRSRIYLGLEFVRSSSAYPKRQALMDTVRRAHPEVADLGLRATDEPADVRPAGAVSIAIHRRAGDAASALAGAAAALIHEAVGGFLRTRPGLAWARSEAPCRDLLTFAPTPLHDPGDDVGVDIAVVGASAVTPRLDPTARLREGGALLVVTRAAHEDVWSVLPGFARESIRARRLEIHAVPVGPDDDGLRPEERRTEAALGGLLGLFSGRTGRSITPERARALRAASLHEEPAELAELAEPDETVQPDERRLDAFVRAFTSVARVDAAEASPDATGAPPPAMFVPPAVREIDRMDGALDCLSSFWDRAGILYRTGDTDELTADPYAAMGAIPALSSSFYDAGDACTRMPVFDPASCDGDPRLWTSCPDGSVTALVLGPRAMVDAGIELATRAGHAVDALRSIAPRLARGLGHIVATDDAAPTSAGVLLRSAFEAVTAKGELAEDRRASLAAALERVVDVIGDLPLARTRVFFDEPEAKKTGAGELLTLAINPDACRCPELLLARCGAHGLRDVARTPEAIEAARAQWDLCWQLPDTPGATIARAADHADVGPMAALMLSRHCAHAMAAGDGAEAGSGARLALRQVLAITEYHAGPRLQAHLDDLDALRQQLAERIQRSLAKALPAQDLDALAEGLDLLGRKDVGLADLSARVDAAVEGGRVDGARLGRLVDAARGLADLHWRLSRGADGRGRSRAGLVFAPDSTGAWAGAYPHNPFACPVIIDSGDETGDFARGLLEGTLRHLIAGFRVRRWAQRLLDDPDATPPEIHFRDLTESERALCPPVILVGDGRSFGVRGLAQLTWLLRTDLPIKVLVLNGIGGAVAGDRMVDALGSFPDHQPFDIGLLAALGRRAFVAQTSLADADHFADGVMRAIAFDGPALVHVHAPSPERDGFIPSRLFAQAELAVGTRAFPLFTFDPGRDGVFGTKLDLAGNPDAAADWTDGDTGVPQTPADWHVTEERFAARLPRITTDDDVPTPVAAFLALPPAERDGRTPCVTAPGVNDGERRRVDAALMTDVDARLRLWRTLQELAGIVTPFTAAVRAEAEDAVAAAQRDEVQRLTSAYEAKLQSLRGEFEREAAARVTAGLMALAGPDVGGEVSP